MKVYGSVRRVHGIYIYIYIYTSEKPVNNQSYGVGSLQYNNTIQVK